MKQVLLNILDYVRYQVATDKCTPEEIRKYAEIATKELNTSATIEELSEFYEQSRSNVSNVISRRPIPKEYKPKRRVYYNFAWFNSIIPDTWHKLKGKDCP